MPEFISNRDSEQPKLVKNCLVYFSVDSVCTSQEILEEFDKAGTDIDEISSIQRKALNKSWVVTFDSAVTKEDALEVATIEIGRVPVFLGDCENHVVLVKIYEAPAELLDMALIGRLSYYGRVLSFRRDRIADSIDNSVRKARMRLHRHVPSTINLAGEFIRIWYPCNQKHVVIVVRMNTWSKIVIRCVVSTVSSLDIIHAIVNYLFCVLFVKPMNMI